MQESLLKYKRGNAFNFSPLRVMLAVGLSYIAFIMLRYVPSTTIQYTNAYIWNLERW